MDEVAMLAELVKRYYRMQAVSLQPLNSEAGKQLYRIEQPRWVLRAYPPESEDDVQALVTVLSFLEQREYPAERLIEEIAERARKQFESGRGYLCSRP